MIWGFQTEDDPEKPIFRFELYPGVEVVSIRRAAALIGTTGTEINRGRRTFCFRRATRQSAQVVLTFWRDSDTTPRTLLTHLSA